MFVLFIILIYISCSNLRKNQLGKLIEKFKLNIIPSNDELREFSEKVKKKMPRRRNTSQHIVLKPIEQNDSTMSIPKMDSRIGSQNRPVNKR